MKQIVIIFILCLHGFTPGENVFSEGKQELTQEQQSASDILVKKVINISETHAVSIQEIIIYMKHYFNEKDISTYKRDIIDNLIEQLLLLEESPDLSTHESDSDKKNQRFSTLDFITSYNIYGYYKNIYLPKLDSSDLQDFTFKKDISEKVVYLTFDDGPYSRELVNYLQKHNISATFFFTCKEVTKESFARYKDVKHTETGEELFTYGYHTYAHDNYDSMTEEEIREDFNKCEESFTNVGINTQLFRPAFGVINSRLTKVIREKNIDAYIWSIDSLDWNGGFTNTKVTEILNTVSWGDILLFHEGANLMHLERLVNELGEKGYTFKTL